MVTVPPLSGLSGSSLRLLTLSPLSASSLSASSLSFFCLLSPLSASSIGLFSQPTLYVSSLCSPFCFLCQLDMDLEYSTTIMYKLLPCVQFHSTTIKIWSLLLQPQFLTTENKVQ